MSFGLYPVFSPPCMVDHLTDGQALLDALPPLDEIARLLKVTPMSAFTDRCQVPETAEDDPQKTRTRPRTSLNWHATAAGMQTIEALIQHLTSGRPPQLPTSAQAHVLWDLQSLRSCLTEARCTDKECRFRLEGG